ncbi:MAG: hypothetical protein AMK69_07945, partial [Nitrospira bacterium SG8_3]
MKTRNKILAGFLLLFLLFLASLGITCLYLYHNPSAVKPFIEKTVSRSTQSTCTIKTLSYSLKPLNLHATGITLRPKDDHQGLHLQIRDLHAVMDLSGPFGRKSLTFKALKIGGFSCQVTGKATLPGLKPKGKAPSLFSRTLGWVVARFIFRDITFQAAEVVNGHVTAEFEDATLIADEIHGELNSEHQISVSASLHMKDPSQNLSFTAPQVHLKTHRAISLVDLEIMGTLTTKNATYQNHKVSMEGIEARAELTYSHKQKAFFFKPADLLVEGVALRQDPDLEIPTMSLHLKTTGLFSMKERTLKASRIDLNLHDTLHLKAALDMGLGDHKKFRLQVLDTHFLAEQMLPLLPDEIKRTLAPISLSGPIHLKGSVDGMREKEEWRLNCDLQSFLRKAHITYRMGHIRVDSEVSGGIGAKGHFPDIDIEAKFEGDKTMVSGIWINPEPFKVGLHLSGKHPVYQIKDVSVRIPRAKLQMGKNDILLEHLQVRTRGGHVDGQEKRLFVPEIQLDSSLLKNLLIALELDRQKLSLQLLGKDVRLMESLLALKLFPPGWQIIGKDSLLLNAVLNERGDWAFTSDVGLQDLRFQNQDASTMGENISLHVKLNGKLNFNRAHIDARANLKVEEGEVLYDRFYLDLKRSALLSSVESEYVWPQKSLKLSSLRCQLKDILNLQMNGTVHLRGRKPQVHLSLNVPKTPLKPLFHHFVLEPFKAEHPSLALLKLGGTIAGNLNFTGTTSRWMAKGRCQWQMGELSSTKGVFSFSEIDLDLPIWVHSSPPSQNLDVKRKKLGGRLSIGSFGLHPLPVQSLNLPLEASPDRLSVTSSTFIKVPGGKIELGPVMGKDLYRSQRSLKTSLSLDAFKLDPLLTDIWNQPMTGTLEGRLDPVFFEGKALRTEGNLMARLFGGEILISGVAASGLFTPTPLLKLNAEWQDLSLEDLTGDTPFGKIEGRLMGFVRDLEIAYGQPQRFNLLLETVKKKGVRQKMSQKAVDSISQIGGGQSPFMGVAGIMTSFFEEFPYEK